MEKFDPKNPNFEAVVRDSFSRQPFMEFVGARLEQVRPGVCDIVIDRHEGLTQQHGFFHGGLVSSLADSAAGYAAYSLFPAQSTVLTVDLKVNFINPSAGEKLIARAQVVKAGRTLYVVKGDAFVQQQNETIHCLTGLFTMMCLHGKSDTPNLGQLREAG